MISEKKEILVVVAGNPNSGKSTLINAIAGTKLHVGNWPGVTVEKKEATFEYEGIKLKLVDLPGTYSLSPYTQEEVIARNYLIHNKPDVIINVLDSTNLERNLYLTIQLLELDIPVVLALNIYDEAIKKGYKIDIKALEEMLNVKVVPTIATKKEGVQELMKTVIDISTMKQLLPVKFSYGEVIDKILKELETYIESNCQRLFFEFPKRWLLLKILENDQAIIKETNLKFENIYLGKIGDLKKIYDEDMEYVIADIRYGFASEITHRVLSKKEISRIDYTEKIDKIVLNRFLGIPIFLFMMWLVFKIAFDFSSPFVDWVDGVISGPFKKWAEYYLTMIITRDWIISLVTDGIIAGTGFVLVFVPVIGMMMLIITFLEGSGYMARAAFVMDRLMNTIGLHGKSFIPMLLGFGCNVPSIYATRILETERDKKLTALLIPFMSCGARLPVYVVFIGTFFPDNSGTVLWSLYILGIFIAIILGLILKKSLFKGGSPVFIMELPPYRVPTIRDLYIHTWQKLRHFVIKAGTYILAISIIVWFLLNLPWGIKDKKDSLLGKLGSTIAPVFKPLGFGNWEAASSLITGLMAKEVVIGTMSQIYVKQNKDNESNENKKPNFYHDLRDIGTSFVSAGGIAIRNIFSSFGVKSLSTEESDEELKERIPLRLALKSVFTDITAYAFIVFVLLYWPCVVVGIAMKQEFGTWKIYLFAALLQTVIAWLTALVINQGGKIFLQY